MEKLQVQHVNSDLCKIYKQIKIISREMKNEELKLYYRAAITAERKEQDAVVLEIKELDNDPQRSEATNHEVSHPTVE